MAEPRIQYAKTSDGLSIAFTIIGDGVPLVFTTNIWGDLNWYSHDGSTRRTIDAIVSLGCRVVRYDGRGMGSSDRGTADFSLATRLLDLEAVLDRARLDQFALCGYGHGGPTAASYAAEHGNRVTHLVLVNTFAVGSDYYEQIPAMRFVTSMTNIAEEQWDLFTMTLATAAAEFKDPDLAKETARMFRSGMSPDGMLAFMKASSHIDLRDVLPGITTPTLVVEDRSGFVLTQDIQRALASGIPGAEFSVVDSYVSAVGEYLGLPNRESTATEPQLPITTGTAIIFFADIVDSTALTERLGDAAFREKARELDEALRSIIHETEGTPVEGKLLGDGVLSVFTSAKNAIEAALRFGRAAESVGLGLHLGIHAGDVIEEDGNVFGGAVNIAARVAAESAPGEVLVSQTVRDLARTSAGVAFEDAGERTLKGVGDPVRMWRVTAV